MELSNQYPQIWRGKNRAATLPVTTRFVAAFRMRTTLTGPRVGVHRAPGRRACAVPRSGSRSIGRGNGGVAPHPGAHTGIVAGLRVWSETGDLAAALAAGGDAFRDSFDSMGPRARARLSAASSSVPRGCANRSRSVKMMAATVAGSVPRVEEHGQRRAHPTGLCLRRLAVFASFVLGSCWSLSGALAFTSPPSAVTADFAEGASPRPGEVGNLVVTVFAGSRSTPQSCGSTCLRASSSRPAPLLR